MAQGNPQDPMDKFKARETYYSFGDNGLTATVGANGFLLQMSRYFPDSEHKSGYCVDTRDTPEPYLVDSRIQQLHTRATNSFNDVSIQPSLDVTFKYDNLQPPKFSQDRWPSFTLTTEEGFTLRTQYFVSDNTLFQTWEFDYTSSDLPKTLPNITAVKDLLIRNLNYVDGWNPFNGDDEESNNDEEESNNDDQSKYKTEILSGGKSLMRSHIEEENAIALLLSVFHDKQYLSFTTVEKDFQLEWSQECVTAFEKSGKFKIILAYTLECAPLKDLRVTSPVPPEKFITERTRVYNYAYRPIEFTSNKHLNLILRRNLEHILSVCSIPVTKENSSGVRSIALTCGDLDGHRIATAASFYCFQFLVQALRHFQRKGSETCKCGRLDEFLGEVLGGVAEKLPDQPQKKAGLEASTRSTIKIENEPFEEASKNVKMAAKEACYTCHMRSRIRKTCQGHLIWLFTKATSDDHRFDPNYWINGQKIENNGHLPERCLVDTPFHIIKAGDFFSAYHEISGVDESRDETFLRHTGISLDDIRPVIHSWIEDLEKRNKLGLYAFPSYKEELYQTFYLTDHAFIWRGIKSAEDLGVKPLCFPLPDDTQVQTIRTRPQDGQGASGELKIRYYSSTIVRRNIQERFTTEIPITKKRMIAVSRSPAQSRFLFRNRDASLFQAMELGLFDKSVIEENDSHWSDKVIDVWKNTTDCQAQHEGRDDNGWNDPLRFALSFIMAKYGSSMNTRPVSELLRHSESILLQSAFPSGLFPGGLDEEHEPLIYESERDRDTYWGITFEIPYILLVYYDAESKPQDPDHVIPVEQGHEGSLTTDSLTHCCSCMGIRKKLPDEGPITPLVSLMKLSLPFNGLIYQENIVELSDEWLYNIPTFFHNRSTEHSVVPSSGSRQRWQLLDDTNIAPETHSSAASSTHSGPVEGVVPTSIGFVLNVPKSKTVRTMSKKLLTGFHLIQSSQVSDIMRQGRTPEAAKKRFWYFRSSGSVSGRMAYNSFHGISSSLSSSLFSDDPAQCFLRHQSYTKLFYEDIVPIQNIWITEFHLSCFTLMEQSFNVKDTMSESYRFPTYANGDTGKSLRRTMMSFRLDGDFFDRYWTCHFLEIHPVEDINPTRIMFDVLDLLGHVPHAAHQNERPKPSNVDIEKGPWCQRRCLELLLFDNMIDQINRQADKILKEAERVIKYKGIHDDRPAIEEGPTEMHYRDFRGANRRYQKVQEILQAIEADLTDNLSEMDMWLDREKGRQIERPRWSFNDESRYRNVITRLTSSNKHKIQQLKRIRTNISKYNDEIIRKLEVIRAGIDQRRAHDTQVFTSVTVIFLPLGFATGLFSMNEAPNNRTLHFMIITAVVAFILTYLVLTLVNKEFYATGLKARIKSNLGARERILLIRRKKAKVDEAV